MDKSILSSLLKMNKSDILKALYEFRENEGDIITAEFKEEVRETQEKRKNRYDEFEEELKKYVKTKEEISKIIDLFDRYEEEYNNEHGLYYEQYYKTGIKDVMKLLLQCLM
ncbi:MAG TPA: hypothetical protein DCZ30_02120 [Clostridiales bacterium]|nr:hypothetical protein [Clostridiales bacterium]